MSEPRLKARFWVQAALRQAQQRDSFGAVVRAGDPDGGAVLVLLRARDNRCVVLTQTRTQDGALAWIAAMDGNPADPETVAAYVDRQVSRDPDLWVVEFDAVGDTPPFDAVLLPARHGP